MSGWDEYEEDEYNEYLETEREERALVYDDVESLLDEGWVVDETALDDSMDSDEEDWAED